MGASLERVENRKEKTGVHTSTGTQGSVMGYGFKTTLENHRGWEFYLNIIRCFKDYNIGFYS